MRSLFVAIALGVALAAVPASAQPEQSIRARTFDHIGPKHCKRYDALHDWATKQFGKKVVGRDICRYGMPGKGGDARLPTKAEYADTMETLRRWKNPPEWELPNGNPEYTPNYYSTMGTGAAGLPSCADESAGNYSTGPDNTNASGATGRWQIMPMHYNGGVCSDLDLSPAGQDACAGRIYESSGAGAWVNC